MLRTMIRRTWAGLQAMPWLAWSKQNSPWSNLPKGWGSPTLVPWTSGRKYGWLGFSTRSISPSFRDRTVWNCCWAGPLHWVLAVWDVLETFEIWLPLEDFDNAEWIWWQWGEMFLKKCPSEIWNARKKGRWGNKRLATDLGQRTGKNATGNVAELPNTTFMDVICPVPNGNNDSTSSMQFQASYTDFRHSEELIDFTKKNCTPKEPYCLTELYKCNLT